MTVDCAHYVGELRRHEALEIEEAATRARERDGSCLARPPRSDPDELDHVGAAFGLHELAVEDARESHQRLKIEDYDGSFFVVMKTARYDDDREEVEFGEINLFLGSSLPLGSVHWHGIGSGLGDGSVSSRLVPTSSRSGPSRVAWRSSTGWSTTTNPSRPGSRRTSPRSRTRSSQRRSATIFTTQRASTSSSAR